MERIIKDSGIANHLSPRKMVRITQFHVEIVHTWNWVIVTYPAIKFARLAVMGFRIASARWRSLSCALDRDRPAVIKSKPRHCVLATFPCPQK